MKLIIKLALNLFTLLIVAYVVPGFEFIDIWATVVTAVIMGVVNTFVKPVLQIVFLPLSIRSSRYRLVIQFSTCAQSTHFFSLRPFNILRRSLSVTTIGNSNSI